MDDQIEDIQKRLADAFHGRRLVFWEDASSTYVDMVDNIAVEGAELVNLTGHELRSKCLVMREKPDKRFVLYRAGGAPAPSVDLVLDLKLAAEPFTCSIAGIWAEECGIRPDLVDTIDDHKSFFNSKERREALKRLQLPKDTPDDLCFAMCAATLRATDSNRRDAVRSMAKRALIEWAREDEESLRALKAAGLEQAFWGALARVLGYTVSEDEQSSVEDLAYCVLEGSCDDVVSDRASIDPAEASRILDELAKDGRTKEVFEAIVNRFASTVAQRVPKENRTPELLEDVNAIPQIDEWILAYFLKEQQAGGIDLAKLESVWAKRRYTFFAEDYKQHYETLISLGRLFRELNTYKLERGIGQDLDSIFTGYTKKWYLVDQYYREFYCAFGRLGAGTFKVGLQPEIEKLQGAYDSFLMDLTDRWQLHLMDEGGWPPESLPSQNEFFKQNVELAFPQAAGGRRVGVIISDALRYEAGAELADRIAASTKRGLAKKIKVTTSAEVSMIPSYTQLGMAALLPDGEMQIDPKTTLVEKEGVSTSGTEERQCILDMRIKGSVALKAENVLSAAKLELDDVPVAVVYHNVIDKIGDSRDSETRVFEEFDRAFSEIEDLVQILVQAGCGKVVITADHGFLYQAEKPDSYVYADVSGLSVLKSSSDVTCDHTRRFVVGNVIPKSDMLVEYSATDLSLKGDYTVAIPKGITRLRLSGSGARFVHGGASLQENVIPVVTVDVTQQSKAHTPHTVDVQGYAEGRLVITGATVSVTVFQCEACGETVLPATVKVGVYSKGGALVSSGEAMLELSSVSENVEERKTRVTLRLTDDVDEYPAVDVRIASRIGNTNKYQTVWEQEYSVNRAFGADF